ncbi:MAG: hypothetical protein M1817_000792 [Caeruleum heppii]|nr:MAG: hypothetical protein M1817_000792 [Caeruleum heppii]
MLFRSRESGSRLRNAKSASSLSTYAGRAPQQIFGHRLGANEDVSRQHALVAASRAYERASECGGSEASPSECGNISPTRGVRQQRHSETQEGPSPIVYSKHNIQLAPASSRNGRILVVGNHEAGDGQTKKENIRRKKDDEIELEKEKKKGHQGPSPVHSLKISDMLKHPRKWTRSGHDEKPLPPAVDVSNHNSAVVQMARDMYFRQNDPKRLGAKASLEQIAKAGAAQQRQTQSRSFRKTVRSSSATSFGDGVASPNSISTQGKRLSEKARNFTLTIKNKLRRAFGRSDPGPSLPVQQVAATRRHYSADFFRSPPSEPEQPQLIFPTIEVEPVQDQEPSISHGDSTPEMTVPEGLPERTRMVGYPYVEPLNLAKIRARKLSQESSASSTGSSLDPAKMAYVRERRVSQLSAETTAEVSFLCDDLIADIHRRCSAASQNHEYEHLEPLRTSSGSSRPQSVAPKTIKCVTNPGLRVVSVKSGVTTWADSSATASRDITPEAPIVPAPAEQAGPMPKICARRLYSALMKSINENEPPADYGPEGEVAAASKDG